MFSLTDSVFFGFVSTAFLFIISAVIVVGSKSLYLFIKSKFPKKSTPPPPAEQPEVKPKKPATTKPKSIRSIEIDPDSIDRIYVKKTS